MSSASYYRIEALQRFETTRRQVQICQFCKKFAKRPLTLLPFTPIHSRLNYPNGLHRSVQQIPVSQIVGSLHRAVEFDRSFRPLRDNQRERWVNMWVLQNQVGWDPILVHQIGNLYFVEDGHHRTSVARSAGLRSIAANVIEYPVSIDLNPYDSLESILARLDEIEVDRHAKVTGNIHPVGINC